MAFYGGLLMTEKKKQKIEALKNRINGYNKSHGFISKNEETTDMK